MTRMMIVVAAVLAGTYGCTLSKQEAPPLSGPSELSKSIRMTVSPDVLTQDGASQSLVTITALDSNSQPIRNLGMRADITVNGVITDFGRLSAHSVVTDSNGRATLVYTAPPASPAGIDSNTVVAIQVIPDEGDFGNATPRTVQIRLVPAGTIGPPPSAVVPAFTFRPGLPLVGETVIFDASATAPQSQVASYFWSFGDGRTASGRTATHQYGDIGNFAVTLTITDVLGRTISTTQAVTVGAPVNAITAAFTYSPNPSQLNQPVHFNASASTPNPGRKIIDYSWDFGDGIQQSSGANPLIDHTYVLPRTYVVTLKVTDDSGASKVTSQTITPQ